MYIAATFIGLAIVTRPINFTIVLLAIFWMVYSYNDLKERAALFFKFRSRLAIAFLLFLLVAFIQMSYWYYTTGHWIYYSYVGEGFNFSDSHVWAGLFSWRKGWFIYTPLALVGIIGFIPLWLKNRKMIAGPLLFLTSIIYIVFSWNAWWYGGGFGARPLVDVLPLVALPQAALISNLILIKNPILKSILLLLIIGFVLLNLFQTYQYSINILPPDGMNAQDYWYIFGKLKYN